MCDLSTREREKVNVILAEYEALRNEILARMRVRNQVLGIAFVVLSAILAMYAQSQTGQTGQTGQTNVTVILLIYPIFAVFLAIEWAHNDTRIHDLGQYIRTNAEIYIHQLIGGSDDPNSFEWFRWQNFRYLNREVGNRNEKPFSKILGIFRHSTLTATGLFLVADVLTVILGISSQPKIFADFLMWAKDLKHILLILLFLADLFAAGFSIYVIGERGRSTIGKSPVVTGVEPVI